MENYSNNIYHSKFINELNEIFQLSERFIYRSSINNKPHIYIDSLGRFKIYNSLSFIISHENTSPQHCLIKYTLKHFKTYFNLSPDLSNYYFYIIGLLIKKTYNLSQKQLLMHQFKTNYYSFFSLVMKQLEENSQIFESIESIKSIMNSILFKVSNKNLTDSIQSTISNYLDPNDSENTNIKIDNYFKYSLSHIFKSNDSDIRLSLKQGLFIRIKEPDFKCTKLLDTIKEKEISLLIYKNSNEEDDEDSNYKVNYCIDRSDLIINNNIFYYNLVENFVKQVKEENIKVIILVDEVSLHFKQKLIHSEIAFFEVQNFEHLKPIFQQSQILTINIFSPYNNLIKSKIRGMIENLTYSDFSNSILHFINVVTSNIPDSSSFNNILIETFHEEQGKIAEIYITRILKIVKLSSIYDNKFIQLKDKVIENVFEKIQHALMKENEEIFKLFKEIYNEIKLKNRGNFLENYEPLGKISNFIESVLFLFKNLISIDTIIERKQKSVHSLY